MRTCGGRRLGGGAVRRGPGRPGFVAAAGASGRASERGRGAPGWRARPVCAPRPAWVTKPPRPLLGDVGVGGFGGRGAAAATTAAAAASAAAFFRGRAGGCTGRRGPRRAAPRRLWSARRGGHHRRRRGQWRRGSPSPQHGASHRSPSRSRPSEAGRHGKGCGCGETRAPGKEAAARAVAFCGRLRFCSLEKGAKLQAPLWSAGWCGRGRDGPQSSGYLERSGRSEGKCGRD